MIITIVFGIAGSIASLKTDNEVSELKDLCYQIQLKAFESLEQTSSWNSPACETIGFKEIDAPQICITDIPNFMSTPRHPGYVNKTLAL